MYKLIFTNQKILKLCRSNTIVRTWNGNLAQIIFDKVSTKYHTSNNHTFVLSKKRIHLLFTEITCLYQTLIFQYKIDSDLVKNNIPDKCLNVAESLMLQIRLNSNHPSYEDLQEFFIDEFKNFDLTLFNQTINLLIKKNLIQSIITDDGHQFFDKNPLPHSHIYFKKQKKLVDCSKEIENFFSIKNQIDKPNQNCTNIFTINTELSKFIIDNDYHLH